MELEVVIGRGLHQVHCKHAYRGEGGESGNITKGVGGGEGKITPINTTLLVKGELSAVKRNAVKT